MDECQSFAVLKIPAIPKDDHLLRCVSCSKLLQNELVGGQAPGKSTVRPFYCKTVNQRFINLLNILRDGNTDDTNKADETDGYRMPSKPWKYAPSALSALLC
jgi:hypothetical protein